MGKSLLQVGKATELWSANRTRVLKYSVEMYHLGLREQKILSAPSFDMLRTKVELQGQKWVDQWKKAESKRLVAEQRASTAQEAERRTAEATEQMKELETILQKTLSVDDAVDWGSLKLVGEFDEGRPGLPKTEPKKHYSPEPREDLFVARLTILDRLFAGLRKRKEEAAQGAYRNAKEAWKQGCLHVDEENAAIDTRHAKTMEAHAAATADWERRKAAFYAKRDSYNAGIDALQGSYADHEQNAVEQYCEMVLNNSRYPDYFPKEFELLYNSETKILVSEYYLPGPEQLPRLKEVKYIASRKEMKESFLTESQTEKNYDSAIYQAHHPRAL